MASASDPLVSDTRGHSFSGAQLQDVR